VHIRDWSPRGSVHDPAAILTTLAAMSAAWAAIVYLRGEQRWPRYRSDVAHGQGSDGSFVDPADWRVHAKHAAAERIPGSGWD
jgi:hypothetical protein